MNSVLFWSCNKVFQRCGTSLLFKHQENGLLKLSQISMKSYSTKEDILVHKKDKVLTVTLNRPQRYNALLTKMYLDVIDIFDDAAKDDDVSILKLTGTGKYYCSGNDLNNFMDFKPENMQQAAEDAAAMLERFVAAFIDFPKILVAAVNGPALGIAVSTLGLCDAVYATEDATFLMPFAKIGQSPEACSSYTFPKLFGHAKATDLLSFGRTLTAQEAEHFLVTRMFPAASFEDDVEREIQKMLQLPINSLLYTKQLMRDNERQLLHSVNKKECERLIERWTSVDCIEAVMKFIMKSKS